MLKALFQAFGAYLPNENGKQHPTTKFWVKYLNYHHPSVIVDDETLYLQLLKIYGTRWNVDQKIAETLRHHPVLTISEAALLLLDERAR